MHRAWSRCESQTRRPLHDTFYNPPNSALGLFNSGVQNPHTGHSLATLQDKVFREIFEIKNQLQQPMELSKIATLFNRSVNLGAFSRKINLSINILKLILNKYRIGMIELRFNRDSEDILAMVVSAHQVWVENFAKSHNLLGLELETYLMDKFGLPYWKIRLLKTNMSIFLADLRGTNMVIGWEFHLPQLYGASFADLNQFSYEVFRLPLAHAIHAVKHIDDEVFTELFQLYHKPLLKINPVEMAELVTAIRANFLAAHNIKCTGIFFRSDCADQPQEGASPSSYLISPSTTG